MLRAFSERVVSVEAAFFVEASYVVQSSDYRMLRAFSECVVSVEAVSFVEVSYVVQSLDCRMLRAFSECGVYVEAVSFVEVSYVVQSLDCRMLRVRRARRSRQFCRGVVCSSAFRLPYVTSASCPSKRRFLSRRRMGQLS
jgi:hypothetical protein